MNVLLSELAQALSYLAQPSLACDMSQPSTNLAITDALVQDYKTTRLIKSGFLE